MKRKLLVSSLLVSLFIFGSIGFTKGQDVNEAAEAYNNASKLATSDPNAAIVSIKECLSTCEKLGEEGADVKKRAETLVPGLYFNVGNQLIKEKKYPQAIVAFQEALKVAEQYKSNEFITKSKSMLPKLFNATGTNDYKEDKYSEALKSFNQAIVYDPDYAKAYYSMGLVYKKMEDGANFETTMDKGLVAAANSKDNKTGEQLTSAASGYFLAAGSKALTDGKAADAVTELNKAMKYDSKNLDTYFYLSSAYNESKQFDLAIETANKALAIEEGDDEKNAKFYYNLGMAYKGKGEKAAACEAFNKALFGQFKENAQYEIEHGVKCNE